MLSDVLFRLRAIFRRKSVERDLEEELRFHLDQQTGKFSSAGIAPDEASRRARMALGGVEQMKEHCRDSRGISQFETTAQDFRFALRQLRRSPGFTLGVVATLALGLGATTALFAITDSVLLRSLPVPHPERLVVVAPDPGRQFPLLNFAEYRLLEQNTQRVFAGTIASNEGNLAGFGVVGERGAPQLVNIAYVSEDYFNVLGVTPSAGRLLTNGDEHDARVVVLAHRFWQRRFNADPAVLGRAVRINGAIVQVAGVASAGFNGTRVGNAPDVYLPLSVFPAVMPSMSGHWNSPARHWLIVTARLLPGISVTQATAQVESLLGRRATLLSGVKGFSPVSSQLFQPLMILLCASGLVLLLACANVAGLLLARASGRQRETAVRLALGAGRGRLMRQLLTENLLLALLGGAAGLCLGLAGSRALVSLLPGDGPQPLAIDITPDWRMFLFAGALSLITGLIFGLGPALAASGRALVPALRGPALSVRWRRLDSRRLLVAAQVALSVVLLVAVALLTRSLAHLEALDLGFSRSSVLVVSLDPAQNGYKDARLHEFYENLRERTSALPGVRMASLSDFTPLDGGNDSLTVSAPGHDPVQVETNAIAPGYLDTLGIKLLAGRDFTELETKLNAAPVALISEGAARILFPSANPIGRRLSFGERYQPAESAMIVGVVRDANYFDVRGKPDPMIYVPVDPGMRRLTLSIRSTGPPERLIPEVRRVAAALDPAVPLLSLQTITEQIDEHNAAERLLATLLGCFGLLALVLAAVGLYGLLAYRVAAGTRDIGIRMALGAPRFGAVSFVLKDVWILVGAGVGAGSVAAIAVARLLTGVLFGVKAIDPVSFGSAIVMLLVTALAASYLPARRAAGVDPLIALRHE